MAIAKTNARRRAYLLSEELLKRIAHYQRVMKMSSEADAVRSLIETGLMTRDTVETLLSRLRSMFMELGDLREVAAELLTRHPRVIGHRVDAASLYFTMGSNQGGRLDADGSTYILRHTSKGEGEYQPYPQD